MSSNLRRPARLDELLPAGCLVDGVLANWIAGRWQTGPERFETVDPTTGEFLARVSAASESQVDEAVQAAAVAGETWAALGGIDRAQILWRMAAEMRRLSDRIGVLDALDAGRPIRDAAGDVDHAARIFEYFAGLTMRLRGATIPAAPGFENATRFVPYGVVGAIIPWNYPFINAATKIAPALATGNAIVLKPAEQTPLSALLFADIATEAGLPPGLLSVVNGPGRSTGQAIVTHPGIGKIMFTGSTATGRVIAAEAGRALKSVTLELGGKAPFIVCADADIANAARALAFSFIMNGGQTCTAATRLVVDAAVKESLLAALLGEIKKIRFGDPLDPATMVGPIITAEQLGKVRAFVEGARSAGLNAMPVPALALPNRGNFLQPAIFDHVPRDSDIWRQEIFGPVLGIATFRDEDEAIELANDTPFGLVASLWTHDARRIQHFSGRLRTGRVWVNTVHTMYPGSPAGGFGQSGLGAEMGEEVVHDLMRPKSLWSATAPWRSPWG